MKLSIIKIKDEYQIFIESEQIGTVNKREQNGCEIKYNDSDTLEDAINQLLHRWILSLVINDGMYLNMVSFEHTESPKLISIDLPSFDQMVENFKTPIQYVKQTSF
jgi:hypothetical protein